MHYVTSMTLLSLILLYGSLSLSVQLSLECLHTDRHLIHLLHHHRSNEGPQLNAVWPPLRVRGQTPVNDSTHQRRVETLGQLNIVNLNNLLEDKI